MPAAVSTPTDASAVPKPGLLLRVLDWAASSHRRAAALLLLCGALFFLPGYFTLPPMDRDESRFAQATKHMVEDGEYVDIRYQDEVRYKKPVGIYWLQAAAVHAAGLAGVPVSRVPIWVYRFPSLIGALLSVLCTYWIALLMLTRRNAVLAALLLCNSVLLGMEARLAKTDAMLLLTIVAAHAAAFRVYISSERGERVEGEWKLAALFWTAVAVSVLIKGPIVLLFVTLPHLAVAGLDRSFSWFKRLKPVPGLLWVLLLAVPWFVVIILKSRGQFLAESAGTDLLSKVTQGQESHGAPPGTYLLAAWLTFWPGIVLVFLAAVGIWRQRADRAIRYLLAWLIVPWVIYELVPTKLPHYVLPTYPVLAILSMVGVERGVLSRRRWFISWWASLPVVGLGVGTFLAVYLTGRPFPLVWAVGGLAAGLGLAAWLRFDRDRPQGSILTATAGAFCVSLMVQGLVLPNLTPVFPHIAMKRILRSQPCPDTQAASAGYEEPSLVFQTASDTLLTSGGGAAAFLAQGGCRIAFVDLREEPDFMLVARLLGLRYEAFAHVDGYNYSKGRPVSISVYRRVPDDDPVSRPQTVHHR